MRKGFDAFEARYTWDIIEFPKDKKPIGYKLIYKIKYKDDDVWRYRTRLLVRGDTQVEGVDFYETFLPIVKMCIVNYLIAFVVKKHLSLFQLDINNAFLHGALDEEVYMRLLQGLSIVLSSSTRSPSSMCS